MNNYPDERKCAEYRFLRNTLKVMVIFTGIFLIAVTALAVIG